MLTDYKGFFRQHMSDRVSMDKEKMKEVLVENGYSVCEYRYEEIANQKNVLKDKIIIYTSSQNMRYKNYIDDLLYSLNKNNVLIPNYDIFRSHENKGYQEIYKRELGIQSLRYQYYANETSLSDTKSIDISYPLIVKKTYGCSSSNVFLVESHNELRKLIKKINSKHFFENFSIKKFINEHVLRKNQYYDEKYMGQFLLQEYIEGLQNDWKVLVFNDKYYALNREVRNNDFRASGSGKLSFNEPSEDILNYAKDIFSIMNVPFISLDIAYKNGNCYLIEFQGTHFGPYTIINSDSYFMQKDGEWIKIQKKSNFEHEYATSIVKFLNKRGV
jgi:glutathione synthase/RimK-type ligase-like ATP-grasp enzyme